MIEVEYDRPHVDVVAEKKRYRDDNDRVRRSARHKVGKETSVHTCVWATIAPSVSVGSAGMTRLLSDWWRGLNPVTPLKHVAFVPADVGAVIINNPKSTVKVEQDAVCALDLDATPLLVFHTVPLPGKYEFHVLGALLAKDMKAKFQLCDLRRDACHHTLDARPFVVRQGVQEKRDGEWWWFRMPTEMWTDMFGRMPGGDPSEHVDYRLALMCAFWKQRDNVVFESEGGHGDQMLRFLHTTTADRGDAFFNMWTEEGRDVDVAGFWGLFLVCAQDAQLWDPWRHWERRLLGFRVREYLCKEKHFVTFLSHNEKLFSKKQDDSEDDDDDDKAAAEYERECEDALERGLFVPRAREDVDEREIQLYRMRHPSGPLPKLWYQVRASDMGPTIMDSVAYDVECGRVMVTHHEFATWAWQQIEALTNHAMKEWRFSRLFQHSRAMRKIPTHIRIMMRDGLQDATRELNLVKEGTSIVSAGIERQYGGGDVRLEDATSREALLQMARKRLPPCMAQHVWEAFSNGKHPENFSRVALSMFLLSAGYSVQEADSVVYMLYGADATLINKKYNGTWNESGYKRENGGNVKGLKRSLDTKKTSPYGCESLVRLGGEGKFHGCPFSKRNTAMSAQPQIISLLQWSGCSDVDIEDIMRPTEFPQQKCERLLLKRNPLIPSAKSVVKHPNHFFRMSQQQQQEPK
jgi:hypothetical protein